MKLFILPSIMTAKPKTLFILFNAQNAMISVIGQTKKTLEDRFKQHLSYVANNTQATGQHFNLPSHNSSHMTISVLEKVHQIDRAHREDRESHWIMRFNLKYKGMNKKR